MVTGADVALRVAWRLRDSAFAELSELEYFYFIQDAYTDLDNAGWLMTLEEDETTTMAASTYEYDVPASFAYVYMLREEDDGTPTTYSIVIPQLHWRIALDASADPEFHFEPHLWSPRAGKTIKVVGQKRPTSLSAKTITVPAGMESFVRERAVSYAAAHLAQGSSQLAKWRERLSETSYLKSEAMLAQHPMEFRVKPSSVHVPGR